MPVNHFEMRTIDHPVQHVISRYETLNYIEVTIRVAAGLLLVFDGMYFIGHSVQYNELLRQVLGVPRTEFLIIAIGIVHLSGGLLIVLGLFTRMVIIMQIPAILVEVYYILPLYSVLDNWEILASALLMILLVFIYMNRSGRYSLDHYLRN
jgi:uncharacterized membrane protein YphA (DoxX/SURF4 family)